MIVCITPNVAIDRTMIVPNYAAGGVFRPQSTIVAAGGKGINVARAIKTLGGESLCAGFLGGVSGQGIAQMVTQEGLSARWTLLEQGETRTCVILVDPQTHQTSVINASGPQVTDADWHHLQHDLDEIAPTSSQLCFCGSLPPGTTAQAFREVLTMLVSGGNNVWVDGSGIALQTAADVRGVRLKINDEEAGAYLDVPVATNEDVFNAGKLLHAQTQAPVVITMGARGAIYVDADAYYLARAPQIEVVSAVGSGDSFLAGLLYAMDQAQSPAEALRYAACVGSANALSVGGGRFSIADVERLLADTQVQQL